MNGSSFFDIPGPRTLRNIRIINVLGVLVLLAGLVWVILGLHDQGQLTAAKWTPLTKGTTWSSYLVPGLSRTLMAFALAVTFSLLFGMVFGIGRISRVKPISWLSTIVVEFCRAVPVLIFMVFFWYFLSFNRIVSGATSPFIAVVIGLTLYNGSVIAELVRSGILSLPRGQAEAAASVGLSHLQTRLIIELPQAITAMTPSLLSQFVVILKDTALGYIVTYPELLRQARLAGTANGNLIPTLIVVAAMFVVVNYSITKLAQVFTRRLSKEGSVKPIVIETLVPAGGRTGAAVGS